MSKAKPKFPVDVLAPNGTVIKIRRYFATKNGKKYASFIVDYNDPVEGRKQISRSTLEAAQAEANDVGVKLTNNEPPASTILVNSEQVAYLRSLDHAKATGLHIDQLCQIAADTLKLLDGRVSPMEACREWINRNGSVLKKITVTDAMTELLAELDSDKKSKHRKKQIKWGLTPLAEAFPVTVDIVTPDQVSTYLAKLDAAERTKKNHRDVIAFLNRWLLLRNYLPKETDWLEGVQDYTKKKLGKIEIWTPEEKLLILAQAWKSQPDMVPFLAINGFTAMRPSEVERLDWAQVDLSDKENDSFIEVLPEDGTKSEGRRRLVPIQDNLKGILKHFAKKSGKVCRFENVSNQISKLSEKSGLKWKRNAMRHSGISYRVTQTGNVPLIAFESGNSVYVVETHYLRKVKPAVAVEYFGITLEAIKAKAALLP